MTPSVIWMTFPGNMTPFRQCVAPCDLMVGGNVTQSYYDVTQYQKGVQVTIIITAFQAVLLVGKK